MGQSQVDAPAVVPEGVPRGDYYSKFGGLWIDHVDSKIVDDRIERITDTRLRENVRSFVRDGFVILPGAVSHATIDRYLEEYEEAADDPDFFKVDMPGQGQNSFSREKTRTPGAKVLDTAMLLPTGQELSFAPEIGRFFDEVFEDKGLAFQSLHFEVGSTQALHQDTAYVVVAREPMKLIASWIALEDIVPGSGELVYYIGGHRINEYTYAEGQSKNFDPGRDGHPSHVAHLNYLHAEAARRGLILSRFSAKKGDVLLWHADLPHGGGEITEVGRSRRSLVTHYCPKSLLPHYAGFTPKEWKPAQVRDGHAIISMYYSPERVGRGTFRS
jgi:hypothetical protein